MEAKDTVIKPDELGLAIIKHPELPMGQAISIEQAKATWPIAELAGYKKGSADMIEDLDEDSFTFLDLDTVLFEMPKAKWRNLCKIAEEGRKENQDRYEAGMRTVVEWVENHGGCLSGQYVEWQAQLEKWGI